MRNFLSARFAAALGIPIVVAFLIYAVLMNSGSSSQSANKVVHFVNYTASVNTVQAESDWIVVQGTTRSTARLALDDARTVYIADGTPGEITCTDFSSPNACVLIAELLGDAVVWFALAPATSETLLTRVALPPVVDMLNGGDFAVLSNGWVVPLATPTKRTCSTPTVSLREFINKFASNMNVSLNLSTDHIDVVTCTSEGN
ncbi:MAG: hypothetical protein EBY23_00850 [Actinobacteria bacterium]|jgi:hypothetical protein|uniref:Unannotated protein n=1 Tax=freshwater metagenome TaxID=449393 RepID=A0A6J7QPJ9_9ZZZZ|nr:hypothetical protein [Actinomycetota bacterium]NDG65473.1 hypothetical protein [Actinomycetota bacterium]